MRASAAREVWMRKKALIIIALILFFFIGTTGRLNPNFALIFIDPDSRCIL